MSDSPPPAVRMKAALHMFTRLKRWYPAWRESFLWRTVRSAFHPDALSAGFGRRIDERVVEYPWILSRLPAGPGRLLDAGSALNHAFLVDHARLREKEITIMTLAAEPESPWRDRASYVYGDLRHTSFPDGYFDYVVSISTIEHVGMDNTFLYTKDQRAKESDPTAYLSVIGEFRRLLKPNGLCLITVPFGKRALRDWLQVFDGPLVDSVIDAFRPASQVTTYFRYAAETGWQLSSREQSSDAIYFDMHREKPWPGCPVAAEAIACIELQR